MIASNSKNRVEIDHEKKTLTVFGRHINSIPFKKLCHGMPYDSITHDDLKLKHIYKRKYPEYSIYFKWNQYVVKLK